MPGTAAPVGAATAAMARDRGQIAAPTGVLRCVSLPATGLRHHGGRYRGAGMGGLGLVAHLRKEFRLDWNGIHGAAHWARVRFHGVSLARGLGLDERVPALFGLVHDSQRRNDDHDPEHGPRANPRRKRSRRRCSGYAY